MLEGGDTGNGVAAHGDGDGAEGVDGQTTATSTPIVAAAAGLADTKIAASEEQAVSAAVGKGPAKEGTLSYHDAIAAQEAARR